MLIKVKVRVFGYPAPRFVADDVAYRKTLTGKEVELDIDLDDKISRIKEKVEEQSGVPPPQQRLIFGGRQMPDDKVARECNITAGSVIHLVLALRGGQS